MSPVRKIKCAIEQLTLEDRAALIADLWGWTDDHSDRQMKAGAAAGKFAALNEAAANSYQVGTLKPFDDVTKEPRESRAAALKNERINFASDR
jgi:hypothetical protein